MDSSSGNMVITRLNKDSFDLDLGVEELYKAISDEFAPTQIKICSDGDYSILFHFVDSSGIKTGFFFVAPSYKNPEGFFDTENLTSVSVSIIGDFSKIKELKSRLINAIGDHMNFDDDVLETSWVQLNSSMQLTYKSMPVKETSSKIINEAYPFIDNPSEYIDSYLESKMPILILSGPPGTGKSTFIRHIIEKAPRKFEVFSVYDEDVMKMDALYTSFISNSNPAIMIMEDADRLLEKRLENANTTMSKILNVSDGIIDLSMKKIIFTTNIESMNDMDQALIRPGRCFDILEFRNLTYNEAEKLATKIDKPLVNDTDSEFPISEIFNSVKSKKTRTFGFR